MIAELQRLRAEIASDRGALARRLDEVQRIPLDDVEEARLAQLAVALHHAYGVIEGILVRVARAIEGSIPGGPDWHQALLASMALEIPGVRPPVLRVETVDRLRRVLAFRHFFRHTYAVDLRRDKLEELRRDALAVREPLERDLNALDGYLDGLARAG